MTRFLLADAFGHHVWATERVLVACAALTDDQLATTVPGTYGSILDTLRHLVGADRAYLFVLTGGRLSPIDEAGMDLSVLRHAMATADSDWATILATAGDPDELVVRRRDDGTESHARAAFGSPRRSITAPTTGARSARPSRRSASSRQRSTSGTTASRTVGSARFRASTEDPARLQPAGQPLSRVPTQFGVERA
jgi:DinB family